MSRRRPRHALSLWRGVIELPQRNSVSGLITREVLVDATRKAGEIYGATEAEILGRARSPKRIVAARHHAWWLLRQHRWPDGSALFSYPEIGLPFGVDHTSVMHGCARAVERQAVAA